MRFKHFHNLSFPSLIGCDYQGRKKLAYWFRCQPLQESKIVTSEEIQRSL